MLIIRELNSLQKVPYLNQRSLDYTTCTKRSLLKCLIHIQPLSELAGRAGAVVTARPLHLPLVNPHRFELLTEGCCPSCTPGPAEPSPPGSPLPSQEELAVGWEAGLVAGPAPGMGGQLQPPGQLLGCHGPLRPQAQTTAVCSHVAAFQAGGLPPTHSQHPQCAYFLY